MNDSGSHNNSLHAAPYPATACEDMYRAVFEQSTDALLLVEAGTSRLRQCNERALALFEATTVEQLAGVCPPAALHAEADTAPSDLGRATPDHDRQFDFVTCTGRPFRGGVLTRELRGTSPALRLVRIIDISERQQLFEIHAATQELARVGGWEYRVDEQRVTWTDEVYRIHELPPGTPLGAKEAFDFCHPESRPAVTAAVRACIDHAAPFCLDLRLITARGREVRVRANGRADQRDGRVWRIYGAFQDITREQRADEALEEHAARLRQQAALLDAANDAIVLLSLDGHIRFWNRAAERIFGWTSADAVGRPITEVAFRGIALDRGPMPVVLTRGAWNGELACATRAGARVSIESHWTLIRDEHGEPEALLTINADLTEKKRIEAGILRTQRLESIGTLAGGIAHDLNNILSPILLSADMLRSRFAGTPQEELIDTICVSARRGAEVVRQVLSFARGAEGTNVPLNLRHIMPDVRKIVRETFPRNISCETSTAHDLWNLTADPTQIHQVMLNLCLNAADAMPEGGVIRIEVANFQVAPDFAAQHPHARPGPHVRLRVHDTGSGIPEEIRTRIFDPFFTTKGPGKGSGLGLATVLAIVHGHGGFLQVESEMGHGTTFTLYFPATANSVPAEEKDALAHTPPGRGELVLVIDDELSVRSIVRQVLEGAGYRIVTASDGTEGLSMFAQKNGAIDLVITDLMMPALDGRNVLLTLQRIAPQLPIIAMSGVTRTPTDLTGANPAGAVRFLLKPFTLDSLLKAVRTTLDEHARQGAAESPVDVAATRV